MRQVTTSLLHFDFWVVLVEGTVRRLLCLPEIDSHTCGASWTVHMGTVVVAHIWVIYC